MKFDEEKKPFLRTSVGGMGKTMSQLHVEAVKGTQDRGGR